MVILPEGWKKEYFTETAAVFRNDQYDLQVEINPRSAPSSRHTRTTNRKPTSYSTQIVQDWFSKGVHGDLEVGSRADTWEEAMTLAESFMERFNAERTSQPPDHINAVHQGTQDRGEAEKLLNTKAAAEALADEPGYSDEIFLEMVEKGTANRHQFVAHREGSDVEILYNRREEEFSERWMHELYAAFPVDKIAIDEVFAKTTPLTITISLSNVTLYRFIFAPSQETNIIVQKNTPVDSPTFEQTLETLLTEKWTTE